MEGSSSNNRGRRSDWLAVFLLAEGTALLIALVVPITPGKTGDPWTPADVLFTDPSYIVEVATSFVLLNLIMGTVLLIGLIRMRRE